MKLLRALPANVLDSMASALQSGRLKPPYTAFALADEVSWVPAVENQGEGVFISFKSDAVRAWRNRGEVSKREVELAEGFKLWKKQYPSSKADFVGAPYMMLHSLAHLLHYGGRQHRRDCGVHVSTDAPLRLRGEDLVDSGRIISELAGGIGISARQP